MGTYAVTGAASGMGAAVVAQLRAEGNEVIGVDLRDAEVVADLSTPQGRASASATVLELCGGVLDGAVMAAGVGPTPGKGRARIIGEVNVLGVTELLTAWRGALAANGGGKAVVFGSNSTTTTPLVPAGAIKAFLAGDPEKAASKLKIFGKVAPSIAYGASKIAVTRWARATAVQKDWAGAGIRLNILAPGAVLTPLLEKQLATPSEAKAIKAFPVPTGGFGRPDHLAAWVVFMLAETADFMCGSVVFVDGGSDAWFRAHDWPAPYPGRRMGTYLQRFKGGRAPSVTG